ncbi:hypothetical protein DCAR_0727439 [Daucus carota subsp. sativus]|uniref:peptidylprolyl isomerase n=1 Tax=Daucus carota subsp. sativus TaxID=79200 RepID=A0AAF1B7Z4_DAUCS|nr:PREDICTED: uncharacterized protein LOC108193667 [Daucus carota subsp. sativus]WOH08003.1 hypothetical protein DCAR_0727439 [Daucus carota subsp. sativus]
MALRISSSPFIHFHNSNHLSCRSLPVHVQISCANTTGITKQTIDQRFLKPCGLAKGLKSLSKPISAVGAGLEASVTDTSNSISVKNAEIVLESQEDNILQLRVDVPGEDTQIVFDKVLANLARTAPPVPGFRRQKGGKTSQVPKSFLLQIIGENRVTKFVIQEIVSSTLADYVKKENLTVKENKINTTQTAEELKSAFFPGKEFGFNAIVELEVAETEASTLDSSSVEIES